MALLPLERALRLKTIEVGNALHDELEATVEALVGLGIDPDDLALECVGASYTVVLDGVPLVRLSLGTGTDPSCPSLHIYRERMIWAQ